MTRLSIFVPAVLVVLSVAGAAAAAPQIDSISPPEGSALRACCITINGSGFGDAASQRFVTIGGAQSGAVEWLSPLSAVAGLPTPGTLGATPVRVFVDGVASNPALYTVLGPPSIDPLSTPYVTRDGGTIPITIRGLNFGQSAGTPRLVTVTGLNFSPTLDASGGLVVDLSTLDHSDAARSLTVDIDGQTATLDNALAVLDPPVLSALSPRAGRASGGTLITLMGDHFGPNSLTIPHSITIMGLSFGAEAHLDNTRLTCLTPAGVGGNATVQMSTGGVAAPGSGDFQYLDPPHISSVTPSSGDLAGGYDITIVGQNFGPDDDALPRGAKVGDKDALPIRWSAPEVLLVRVPAAPAPGTVDVTLSIDGVSTVLPNAFTYSSISGAGPGALPVRLELAQNGPNPFAAAQGTEIRFNLPAAGVAMLDVFDTRGRLVKRLASGVQPAGMRMVRWDGRDNSGRVVAGGVYLYRLRAAGREIVRRMNLVR